MSLERRVSALDIITCILSVMAFITNFAVFLIMLMEQISTGWGYPTRYEMLVLLFWMVQLGTVPLLLAGVIYIIYSLAKSNIRRMFVLNTSIVSLTVIMAVLSVVFEFN